MKLNKTTTVLILLIKSIFLTQALAINESQKTDNIKPVTVIINSVLYPNVKITVDRYLEDLKNEGYKVIFHQWDNNAHPDVEELKNLLNSHHKNFQIQGAVLIGKLPYALGKEVEDNYIEEGPIEIYLMDFKNEFIKNNEGQITEALNPIKLDIWVSRIWAPHIKNSSFDNKSEADLINNYFEKNHLYRTCQSPVPDLKINFYANNDSRQRFHQIIEYLNSWKNFYQYLEKSDYPEEYLDFVKNNPAQYLHLISHSRSSTHAFQFSELAILESTTIAERAHIKQPFLFLAACSACKFSNPNSLGTAYLFGQHSSALVIAGMTMPGNLLNIPFIHSNSNSFGNNIILHFNSLHKFPFSYIFDVIKIICTSHPFTRNISFGWDAFLEHILLVDLTEETLIHSFKFDLGFTLLGDPTLKPYINMDWCTPVGANKDQ